MDFKFDPGSVSVIPLWITFPSLPLGFWSTEALSKLASVVGKPLYTEKITAEMEKVSYARVLVETDISQPLPDSFEMQTKKGVILQQIEYEWKPKFCCECIKFGHNSDDCWLKEKQRKVDEGRAQPKETWNRKQQLRRNMKWLPKEKKKEEEASQQLKPEGERKQTGDKVTENSTDKGKIKGKGVQQSTIVMVQSRNRFEALQIDDDPGGAGPSSFTKK
ncbi:PREDICTED: uncharacterized protein LOC109213825 [Nicotiana attenuata]|uniref:uncharacterized protein LOC109213825 n=1 Tax=Nicotiana attenuata TaxID=49451 RepID=UPI00090551B5|nr:PREDICTED: uncharacterized protein LOC109213825 [Nicotiana attenuata]